MQVGGRYTVRVKGKPDTHFPFKGRDYHDAKAAAFKKLWDTNVAEPNTPVTIFLTQTDAIYEWIDKELSAI